MRAHLRGHNGVTCPKIDRDLNFLPIGLTDDANVAFELRREDMKLPLGLNSATAVGKVCRHHIHKANSLVRTFRPDAMTLLELVDLLSHRLWGDIVNRCQREALLRTMNSGMDPLLVNAEGGLFVRLTPGLIVRR